MFPGIFEWVWDRGHLVFMGIFWAVVIVLISGLGFVVCKSLAAAAADSADLGELLPGEEDLKRSGADPG